VFKDDNDGGHAYFAKGLSSLVAGPSMEVQAVPYNLTPNNTQGSCIVPGGGVRTRRVTVSGLGYDYVVPMLTGWNLSYPCSDEHVLRAGVWLHDINYDRSSGTLTYNVSSVLRDDDAFPGHLFHRNVALLGFWASDRPFVPDRPLSIKR